MPRHDPAKLCSTNSPSMRLPLPPPLSENCTIVVDASAGCNNTYPCTVRVGLSGSTEEGYDLLTVWRVIDRAAPLASLGNIANQLAIRSGDGLSYSGAISTTNGMFIIRFTSDIAVTAAGWTATWSVSSAPLPTK